MSLIGEERKQKIVEWIEREGKVKTSELIERLNVSGESIRRYLEELEKEHRIKRVYGGAVLHQSMSFQPIVIANMDGIRRIAYTAFQLIPDDTLLYIGHGVAAEQVASRLRGRNVTVVTPSLTVAKALFEQRAKGVLGGEIQLLGGTIDPKHLVTTGEQVLTQLQTYMFDLAILSVEGVDASLGLTCDAFGLASITQSVMSQSRETFLLTDHTQLNQQKRYRVCDFSKVTAIISDFPEPQDFKGVLAEHGVDWKFAP
ncbi:MULTISPECIES: DeoR/GlpR family DNA-binding transcription regulator [Exiguobacterium]|uniref:DeoR/GlpR family DNA-binding transcription regulator n=1 Tax=Exiguobacterium profundum TaxID=307643 RepID=A0ABY8B606_9BACL|nr:MULTISPECIES: DeoR/GlpR family DNA-binding transcription regulator [Exiguobacterium]MBQ6458078.1 DeoR/GlpR transcriptional regulator [Exiguobacterium sp.]WED56578.1 DeoR/GlpR family DNA-binding transcription regulator [Exiguobacterium profundum]